MKKLSLIACVTFAAFAATPTKADVTIVRWNSGMCQIWDNAAGPPPWQPTEFILVARGVPDWAAAGAMVNELYASGRCGWAAVAPAPVAVVEPPPPPVLAPPPPTPVLAPPPAPEPWIPPPPPWVVTR